ncbi:hypothetical protein NEOKW01_1380 [Nematocida sp. AWRm80]|nr:hypothetical protein NEOKW01_1380 [Nematocida sp. AWRm80]
MKISTGIIFRIGLAASIKGMISPLCGGVGSMCLDTGSSMIGNLGGMSGMSGMDTGINMTCHLNSGGMGGSNMGIIGSFNPCAPSMVPQQTVGLDTILTGLGNLGLGGLTSSNNSVPMLCNAISLPDKNIGLGGGSGMWANDCYSKISSIFLNGFVSGQKANDICCGPAASLYGNKLMK